MAGTGTVDGTGRAMRFGRAPGARPLLGHVGELRRRPLEFMGSLAAHGDLVEIRLGPRPAYVLCHPDLAHQVLTDLRSFDRTGLVYDRVRAAMGNGLATVAHQDHRRQRLIMQPVFRHEHLRGYAAVMSQEIATVMDGWRDGQRVDLVDEMFTLTTAVALRTLFSSAIGPDDAERLRKAFDEFLRGVYVRAMLPVAGRLPTPGNRRYAEALRRWRGQVAELVAGYRGAEGGRDDLMSRLLAARDEGGGALSDEELSDQVAVLLLAGGETTSAALAWSCHLLDGHPPILRALRAEVDEVLHGGIAGWEDLPRLGLTARVVQESLRLYPPAWVIPRTTVRETPLAGRTLPAGSMVVFSPYVLQRRPDRYPRPDAFDPDRWLGPARDGSAGGAAGRGAFLPFGGGATKCIGQEFGMAEATLVLASLVARWRLAPEPDAVMRPAARAVLVPRALPVRLERR